MSEDYTSVEMVLFVADRKVNQLMRELDLFPDYKVFVSAKERATDRTTSRVNDAYIHSLIEKSRSNKEYWIPAIQFGGRLFVADGIREISDGNKTGFVREAA